MDVAYIEQNQVEALPPTLIFNSQSCAEYWWPTLKKLVLQTNATAETPLDMIGDHADAESSGQIAMYSALRRFPHIVGAYFDWRTSNFHNTVGRALGIDDVWLRYEFGSNKGHLHSHAVGVSTSMSCMVNRARADAERMTNAMDADVTPSKTSVFREFFAETILKACKGRPITMLVKQRLMMVISRGVGSRDILHLSLILIINDGWHTLSVGQNHPKGGNVGRFILHQRLLMR